MRGLKLKFSRSPLEGNFRFDENGALIASRDSLQLENVAKRVSKQLKADTGLYRKMTDMYYRTDVEFTDNPYGNTPVLGSGFKRYGKRPLNVSFKDRLGRQSGETPEITAQLAKRERKIEADQLAYMAALDKAKPDSTGDTLDVCFQMEQDQVMTGGGFDGNHIGEVQLSALKFVSKGNTLPHLPDSPFYRMVVDGAIGLRKELEKDGLVLGSLTPWAVDEVRMDQDNDGLIGFPVYDHGWNEYSYPVATRLLIETGVDSRFLVGKPAVDPRTGEATTVRVIQGIGYVLDHMVISDPSEVPSIVTLLARIQKHAWKKTVDGVEPKKPKTRSVYPGGGLSGMIEAMVGSPFIKALQEHKCRFMPSLQDKPTRVGMIKDLYRKGRAAGYEWLSLDESQYDATIIGDVLATVLYYAMRPFFNSKYYDWVDFAIYTLTYKYIICDTSLCSIHSKEYSEAKDSGEWLEVKPFTIFGMIDALISGAKLTHVGGSFYGGATIHHALPMLMSFEPFLGVQAGDDCLFAYPRDRVDFSSMEATYGPVEDAAKQIGLDINKLKQVWHVVDGELVNVFLQDTYHENSNTWGIGSIFRPLSSVFFSERDKGLSIAEQLLAEISRMEQGSDNPYAEVGVREWLSREQFIGLLFKEYGVSAFDRIVDSIGKPIEQVFQTIDVGSFTFGVSRKDMKEGSLKILPIIAEVASSMEFTVNLSQALKSLSLEDSVAYDGPEDAPVSGPDIGDSDDVVGD